MKKLSEVIDQVGWDGFCYWASQCTLAFLWECEERRDEIDRGVREMMHRVFTDHFDTDE